MPILTQGKTNRKFILIVLVFAILVSGGILGYLRGFEREILSLSKFPEIKKPEKVVKEETAEWKTYKNEEYGFEIKYPKEWQVIEAPKEVIAKMDPYYKNLLSEAMFCHYKDCSFYRDCTPENFWCGVSVSVYPAPEELLKEYYKDKEKLHPLKLELQKEEDIILRNRIQAIKFIFASTEPDTPGEVIVVIQKEGKIIEIKDKWAFSLEDLKFAKVFNQMLSTFRFLE